MNVKNFILIAFSLFVFENAHTQEICIVGDTGMASPGQKKVAQAMANANCLHILHTGDIVYPMGVTSKEDPKWKTHFEEPYKKLFEMGAQFYLSGGNHDYLGSIQAIIDYSEENYHVTFPEHYYHFKIDNLCIWAISSEDDFSEQKRFLRESLNRAKGCDWKIFFGHTPVVSSGKHGNSHTMLTFLRDFLDEIDFYLSGHDHNLSDEGSLYPRKNWATQLVSGAGAKLRPLKKISKHNKFALSYLGFLKINFSPTEAQIQFIGYNDKVLHSRSISK